MLSKKAPDGKLPGGKAPTGPVPAGKMPGGKTLLTKYVTVEKKTYPVLLSDDSEALQAADAAGGAIVGIWRPERERRESEVGREDGGDRNATENREDGCSGCLYLVEDPEDADDSLLEKAVRRRFGFPFIIGETRRLIIREFAKEDPTEEKEEAESASDCIFSDRRMRDAYIDSQYRFRECGLWALVERRSGIIVGKAGITDGELGYHIYRKYRGKGYALEACRRILLYAAREMGMESVFLRTEKDNLPSVRLAGKLGFQILSESEADGTAGRTLFCEKRL